MSTVNLHDEIERFRERLLDLSLRNPLLSYRKSKRRILQVVNELPDVMYERLVDSETARQKKSSRGNTGKQWDEASFMRTMDERKGSVPRQIAEELLQWVAPMVSSIWWGAGAKQGFFVPTIQKRGTTYRVLRMATDGWCVFRLDWLRRKAPFQDEHLRKEFVNRLNEIPGVQLGDEFVSKRIQITLNKLQSEEALDAFKSAVRWLIEQIDQHH